MKKAYVVLGMHRSGTSSVAGVLALLGAAAPKSLMGPAADNPKGFWESYAVSELNDRILATGDSNWADWRAFPQELSDPFRGDGVRLLRSEFDGADEPGGWVGGGTRIERVHGRRELVDHEVPEVIVLDDVFEIPLPDLLVANDPLADR